MEAEKTLVNVNKGQDAYSVIGNYILNHVTAIEDMIAVIQINGVIIKELYMVDVNADGYFYWESDWWEGEEDVALLDFFPVSDAERIKWIPCSERLPETEGCYITTARWKDNEPFYVCENEYGFKINEKWNGSDRIFDNGAAFGDLWGDEMDNLMEVIAWMPLPEPYREGER